MRTGGPGFLKTGDLEALIAPSNPVIDISRGPDCLFVQAAITRMTTGSATQVSLTPANSGLQLDVELDQVNVGMHLSYAVACLSDSRDITITASHIKVTGMLNLGVSHGAFDIKFINQNVQLTGLNINLGGVPGDIVDLLHAPDIQPPPAARVASAIRGSEVVSNHRSTSRVVVFAPCSDAAESPTIMYATLRASSSKRKRRSAWVSAESAIQSPAEPFFRCAPQVLEHVVDAGDVHAGVAHRDSHGAAPQRLSLGRPATFLLANVGDLRVHAPRIPWNTEAGNGNTK